MAFSSWVVFVSGKGVKSSNLGGLGVGYE